MKLGGLFSGIGGFELAWQRNGGEVAWMCEIDPAARRVLQHRFPGVPVYPDVAQLHPAEVEPVDVLTGGSPCQGFSMAGARTGLEHGESRLFADYVRILDGLAERGLQWAVWENVPGVLSITNDDGERTFEHVVAALVGADEPVRLDRNARWNTGLAVRDGRAVAWRVVDSRHFGVPQRRRRVYGCVAVGRAAADRAGRALLAKPEGVRRDTQACGQARQDVAGTAGSGVAGGGVSAAVTSKWAKGTGGPSGDECQNLVPAAAHTLRAEGHDASEEGTGRTTLVPQRLAGGVGAEEPVRVDGDERVAVGHDDLEQLDLAAGPGHGCPRAGVDVVVDQDVRCGPGDLSGLHGGSCDDDTTVVTRARSVLSSSAVTPNADCWTGGDEGTPQAERVYRADGKAPSLGASPANRQRLEADGTARTLHADGGAAVLHPVAPSLTASNDPSCSPQSSEVTQQVAAVHAAGYGVRRLTPVEAERLQAFPDGWTEPAGSDSARYRALGNAITVNVADWLFRRMAGVS